MKVVVATCNKYTWLAPIFLHFYRKNWPDNPYETEFVTETAEVRCMPTYQAGNLSWADRMAWYLNQYVGGVFLLLVEDYILTEGVDTALVKRAVDVCTGDVGCVRISEYNPLSRFLLPNGAISGFKEYPLDKPYSVSLQASIWQKDFFLDILKQRESVWQTELEGSKRVHTLGKRVLWSDTPAFTYVPHGYMQKGVVDENVERWTKENW